ncbi:hypothetical protein ZIOFF_024372 [Zingiber officinale]|uniref:protein-serine/threonine phosphatase n=1 Tax=Zingiber officinale TaxID=94328 RepID=A0A8J5GY61_ZINOF|nr:hypothetical protein ZIOFF_024372 [Zingiber officinale]
MTKMAAITDLTPPLSITNSRRSSEKNGGPSPEAEIREVPEGSRSMKAARPPRSSIRHSVSAAQLDVASESELNIGSLGFMSLSNRSSESSPRLRSGSCTAIGGKQSMEDEHICIDNIEEHIGESADISLPGSFYGVFDGHGGKDAAFFVRTNILKFIIEDDNFPRCIAEAIKSAFVRADYAFSDASSLDITSGTTALAALIFGRFFFVISQLHAKLYANRVFFFFFLQHRTVFIANVGDCRAVLGRRGRAVDLSRDHKPSCSTERLRIEKLGGYVDDGYLNGQLSVARALGDWHMKGSKGSLCPLSAEPELQETVLTDEDEFLIMGCDGLWDVMTSQCAVTMARKELRSHNDPTLCSQGLVQEALKRNSGDNLTVLVVCFSPDPPPLIHIPRPTVRRSISVEGLNFLKGFLESNC